MPPITLAALAACLLGIVPALVTPPPVLAGQLVAPAVSLGSP
jgi:hypothetical protein